MSTLTEALTTKLVITRWKPPPAEASTLYVLIIKICTNEMKTCGLVHVSFNNSVLGNVFTHSLISVHQLQCNNEPNKTQVCIYFVYQVLKYLVLAEKKLKFILDTGCKQ